MHSPLESILQLIQKGQMSMASAKLRLLLKKEPSHAHAWQLLAYVRLRQNLFGESIDCYRQAIDLQPKNHALWNGIALAYLRNHQANLALDASECALSLNSQDAAYWANYGYIQQYRQQWQEALRAFERTLQLDPDILDVMVARSQTLRQLGRVDEALQLLKHQQIRDLESQLELLLCYVAKSDLLWMQQADQLPTLLVAETLVEESFFDAAILVYKRYLQANPDDVDARYLLSSLQSTLLDTDAQQQLTTDYAEALYDRHAEEFEQRLLYRLQYRAPQLLRQFLPAEMVKPRVLDLGCGTGLAGEVVTSHYQSAEVIGVDLSGNMLRQAECKAVYQKLFHASVADFLSSNHGCYDLIVLLDVLIYLPNAEEILRQCLEVLNGNGRLVFTIEHSHDENHQLQHNGRWAHNADTLMQQLQLEQWSQAQAFDIRFEAGRPIAGQMLAIDKADLPTT